MDGVGGISLVSSREGVEGKTHNPQFDFLFLSNIIYTFKIPLAVNLVVFLIFHLVLNFSQVAQRLCLESFLSADK